MKTRLIITGPLLSLIRSNSPTLIPKIRWFLHRDPTSREKISLLGLFQGLIPPFINKLTPLTPNCTFRYRISKQQKQIMCREFLKIWLNLSTKLQRKKMNLIREIDKCSSKGKCHSKTLCSLPNSYTPQNCFSMWRLQTWLLLKTDLWSWQTGNWTKMASSRLLTSLKKQMKIATQTSSWIKFYLG